MPNKKTVEGENQFRRSKVSELGFLTGRWFKKHLSAWRPSFLGITVYKDVMSIVKMILLSPEKLKVRKISTARLLSLMYEGSDLTMGVMILLKLLEISSVGQLHAEIIG